MSKGDFTADRDVTSRQMEMLGFISGHQRRHGFPPSIRELASAMGHTSTNGINEMLESLRLKGCVTRSSLTSRGVLLTPKGRALLGEPSLQAAAEQALRVLMALSNKPLGEQLDRQRLDAQSALRKAGVR